jgi:kynurenine formamidase
MLKRMSWAVLILFLYSPVYSIDLDDYQLIDLSHTYGADTVYWPTSPTAFAKEELANGMTEGGWFYSAYSVCTPEHGGTHIDAPVHFAEDGHSTDEIPLADLLAPAIVIDVSAQAAENRDYRLTENDVAAFEDEHGLIAAGSIVLLRTDWSQRWPNTLAYLGDDTPGDADNLRFPGYGEAATRVLTEERGVAMLGIDSASIDYGKSQDFIAHRVGAAQGVSNLENLTNLDQLPATGAIIIALPMKIEGGSGGPVRVVALVPK